MIARLALLLGLVLALVDVSLAQPPGSDHWLIGRWDGDVEGFTGQLGPARTFTVTAVTPDGSAQATWNVTGAPATRATVTVEGERVRVITGGKATAELTRDGADTLAGTFTAANGRSWPVKLARARASTELDGQWTGRATPTDGTCRQGTYDLTIKDGRIAGTVAFHSREFGGGDLRSTVAGEVTGDKAATLRLAPADPNSRRSRFSATFADGELRATDGGGARCVYEVVLKRR